MSDATRPDEQLSEDAVAEDAVSEEQLQEYARQLRSAPAEQLVTEVLYGLLNAAQVKVGRRDARLLIDLGAVMLDHVRPYVSKPLAEQTDQVLSQLRLAQVRAEGQPADQRQPEPNDLAATPAPPAGAPADADAGQASPAATPPPPAQPSPVSRLWVPGRDF